MMAINGYQVIDNFEVSEIYLLHPAKKIFQKFPKIAFLEFILILLQVFYLVDSTQVRKKQCLKASLESILCTLSHKKSLFRSSLCK